MSGVAGRDGNRFTFGYKSIFAQMGSEDHRRSAPLPQAPGFRFVGTYDASVETSRFRRPDAL